MTHSDRDDVPAQPGEHVVQLDTGELVAVRCARQVVGAVVHYHATARVIDEDGAPVRLLIAIPEQEGESAVERHLGEATPGARRTRSRTRGATRIAACGDATTARAPSRRPRRPGRRA